MKTGQIVTGGITDAENNYVSPTVIKDIKPDDPVMQEEIFGPVLPVIQFADAAEAQAIIAKHPNPLAFYIYSSSSATANEWLQAVPAGGACVNNSSWHLTNHHLPFGGRGFSGTGQYHGKFSLRNLAETFYLISF